MNEPLSVTISLPEAAKLLGISESLAREMSRAGEFPGAVPFARANFGAPPGVPRGARAVGA